MDIVNECLDNLAEAMSRFGGLVPLCHQQLVDTVLPLLDDSRNALRRRAMHCISEPRQRPGPPAACWGWPPPPRPNPAQP
jgi:hypothetical protein